MVWRGVSWGGQDGRREGERAIGTGRISLASALGSCPLKVGEEDERPARAAPLIGACGLGLPFGAC